MPAIYHSYYGLWKPKPGSELAAAQSVTSIHPQEPWRRTNTRVCDGMALVMETRTPISL